MEASIFDIDISKRHILGRGAGRRRAADAYGRVFDVKGPLAEEGAAVPRSRPAVRAVSLVAISALVLDGLRSASVAVEAGDYGDLFERPVVRRDGGCEWLVE